SSASATGRREGVRKLWARVTKKAGLEDVRIHDLRHTFASMLASSGASLTLVGSLLGHTKASTTPRYAHIHLDPQRAGVEIVATGVKTPRPAKVERLRGQ